MPSDTERIQFLASQRVSRWICFNDPMNTALSHSWFIPEDGDFLGWLDKAIEFCKKRSDEKVPNYRPTEGGT